MLLNFNPCKEKNESLAAYIFGIAALLPGGQLLNNLKIENTKIEKKPCRYTYMKITFSSCSYTHDVTFQLYLGGMKHHHLFTYVGMYSMYVLLSGNVLSSGSTTQCA